MRSMKLFGMILLFLLIPLGSYADESENTEEEEWGIFVNNPTQENYFALGKLISQCERGNEECESLLSPHYTSSQKLFKLVKRGNRKAIDITFASLEVLDGGELGDALRSLGYLVETDPEFFLRKVRSHCLSLIVMKKIVGRTPLELTDQFDLQLRVFQERLKSMSSLQFKDPFISLYKDESIKNLEERIEFFEKNMKEMMKLTE